MEEKPTYYSPAEEEDGLDIIALVKDLWAGRKTILIVTGIFLLLGLISAFTMKRTYTVTSTMVPQVNSRSSSSLSSLASLAGVDLGMNTSAGDLSPLIYPQIVSSVPFRLELMNTPLHYQKADTAVSMFTYAKEYAKPSVGAKIKKYTIGLPFLLLSKLSKPKEEQSVVLDGSLPDDDTPRPLVLSKEEAAMLGAVAQAVSLSVDKKEGYITLHVTGSEPLQTAELAVKAQQLLQREVTRFRTERAQNQLEYVQARYDELKAENEALQARLAAVRDRSHDMPGTRTRLEQERLQSKYAVSSAVFSEMAKQLETAKMQVKRDTPNLAIIQPVTVPRNPSNSRGRTLFIWVFLGGVLGCGIVLGKAYLPKLKEMFAKEKPQSEAEGTSE